MQKKLGFVLAAAFLAAGCQTEEERAAAEAARAARARYEQQEISAARDRIAALENRFDWNVRRTGGKSKRTRCNVTDRTDGSVYSVNRSGSSLQSGPGSFLKENGSLIISGRACLAFDNAKQVYCETRTNDVPVCRPYSLMPDSYKPKIK